MVKTKAKRLLSLLLAFAMVLSLTVTPVYAADDDTSDGSGTSETGETSSTSAGTFSEPEAVEAEAVAAVEDADEGEELVVAVEEEEEDYGISLASDDGEEVSTVASVLPEAVNGVITLTENVELAEQYEVTDNLTIDLKGYSITRGSDNTTAALIKVDSGITLTVQDTSTSANGYIDGDVYTKGGTSYVGYAILTNGSVTLESGTLKGCRGVYVSGDNASLTVNGGTISGTYSATSSYGIYQTGGTVSITNGTVSGYRAIYGIAGTLDVSGGTVSGTQIGIMANYSLDVNVSGSASVTGTTGIYAYQDYYTGTVTISGGSVGDSNTSFAVNVRHGTAYITGGTVTASGVAVLAINSGAKVYIGTSGSNSGPTLTADYGVEVLSEATVEIYSGEITATTCGVYVQKGTLNVTGGKISSTVYGISTNGSNNTDYYPNTITISGGEISGAWGMYLPAVQSTTSITGGTITGSTTGIEIRAGSLTVSGGTITGNGSPNDFEFNGSGTTIIGAGIGVSQHTTNQVIDVTITGGEISGYYGVFEVNTNASNTAKVSISISGDAEVTATSDDGAAVYSVSVSGADGLSSTASGYYTNGNTDVSVTGGTYSTDVSSYVDSENYTTVTNNDGTTSVYAANEEAVAAIGSTTYTTLSEAFSAVTDGQTIKLLTDETVTDATYNGSGYYQVSGKTVTLDLNGKTLSVGTTRVFGVLNGGSLTIKDGTVQVTQAGTYAEFNMIRGTSTFKAENVTFDGGDIASYVVRVAAGGVATIEMTDCTMQNVSGPVVGDDDGSSTVKLTGCNYSVRPVIGNGSSVANYTIVLTENNPITAESGNYEATNALYYNYVVEEGGSIDLERVSLSSNLGAASLTVEGGTVTASKSVTVGTGTTMTVKDGIVTGTVNVSANGSLTIEDGTVNGRISTNGNFTMTGGTVTKTTNVDGTEAIYVGGGTVNISGGKIASAEATDTAKYQRAIVFGSGIEVSGTISGGTFTGSDIALLTRNDDSTTNTVKITGGTFIASTGLTMNTSNLVDTEYGVYNTEGAIIAAKENSDTITYSSTLEDKTVVVGSGVAEVNGTKYGTLQAAINAAGSGDTVKMLTSVAEDITVASGKDVTLDLNGYTLTNVSSDTITVEYGAALTITDSSATETEAGTGKVDNVTHAKAAIYNNGTVILNGGTYTRSLENGKSSSDNGDNSFYVLLNHGTMTINSGVTVSQDGGFSSMIENGYYSYNSGNASSGYVEGTNAQYPSLTITGGTFTGGLNTVKNDDGATLVINGGSFTNTTQATILNWNVATINGGTFESAQNAVVNGYADDTIDKGELTITGGTFKAGEDYDAIFINENASGDGTITITGGSYSDDSADTYLTGTEYQLAYKDNSGTTLDYKVVNVIYGKNIKLEEGKIILNVYVTNNGVSGTDSISGTLDDESNTNRTEVKEDSTENYAYVLSQKVYANMMAKTLTVKVILSDDYVVTYTTSVREYCVDVLTSKTTSTEQQATAKAMLNYGAAAQNYSGYDTDNLANDDYEYETGATELKDASTMYSNGAKLTTKTDSDYNGVKLSTMNVVFDYDFTVKLTFNGELSNDNLTSVSLNGTLLKQGEDYTVSGKVITITGLSAAEMAQKISIVTTDGELTKTSNLPGLYYAYLSAKSTNEAKQLLGQTLYAYCNAVVALNSTSTNATNE